MLREAILERFEYDDLYTLGTLRFEGLEFCTLELPWKDNERMVSCIPEGFYLVDIHVSKKLGTVLHILGVNGRSWIYIHSGNYTRQIHGCILVGSSHADIDKDGIMDVTSSRVSMDKLLEEFNKTGERIGLTITSGKGLRRDSEQV